MDCAACGKPISATAKFCGKCGAPVKRPAKAPETDVTAVAAAVAADPAAVQAQEDPQANQHEHGAEHEHAHSHELAHEDVAEQLPPPPTTESKDQAVALAQAAEIEELVVTLSPPMPGLEGSPLLDLDLNLAQLPPAVAPVQQSAPAENAVQPAPTVLQLPAIDNTESLQRLEQQQQELKKTLEKHSLLLDFISLASQQQTHQQSQPNPSDDLLHNLIEQQTQFAVQLAQLQNHLSQEVPNAPARLPEELKLLLEKQRIELQKSFSLGVAQNTENLTTLQQAEMLKVQEMLTANTLAAQAIEKNLTPLIQSVNDLKTKVQAVVKKVEELPAPSRKASYPDDAGDKQGGGAMIFVIGMLCGLTVVLCSLAIYNFLSHDTAVAANSSHDKPAVHDTPEHDSTAHDSPAHEKPAEHGSAKEKSH